MLADTGISNTGDLTEGGRGEGRAGVWWEVG